MRYKAYIDSKRAVAMAQYRTGFKPENQTFASREEALTALAQELSDRLSPTEDDPETGC